MKRYNLVVLGAGHAGAATALFAAEAGLRVALIERRPLDEAGARWVNDAPAWMFERVGLTDLPGSISSGGHTARLFGDDGGGGLAVRAERVAAIDMRLLGSTLVSRAESRGAVVRDRAGQVAVEGDTVRWQGEAVRADFVVDASGLAGINLLGRAPSLRTDLCVAAQDMRIVKNLDQAHSYLSAHGGEGEDSIVTLCPAGGYSVLNVRLIGEQVFVLAGSIPALGFATGRKIIDDFVARQPWIGERVYGGERAIPLAPPLEPFVRGRWAQVGDAARQVFAAHGSGTGSGLIAARLLVDALVEKQDLGLYASRWFRELGPTHFVYDLLRRASRQLRPGDATRMLESQLLDRDGIASSMLQKLPPVRAASVYRQWRGSQRAPDLARNLGQYLSVAPALIALAATYPQSERRARLWHAAMRQVYARLPVA